ncbi:ankyrin repeat-containing domain protein [Phyllosticta citribraziliensis]|uniref:Ankyrin repeat-containing domain protein n=1 Tax=Phyllosticta citribraziliensis TaxID=989973 RepID=A0ABR1L7X6_9PEZI
MDPLSIAASAIAVATLAKQICGAFSEMRSTSRSLPGRLHALNNEVADLELVLIELASLAQRRVILSDSKHSTIPHHVSQASSKLRELQNIVERLSATSRESKACYFLVHVWRKEKGKLLVLQEDIRSIKCNLNIVLGASNSQDIMQMRLNLAALSVTTTRSTQEQIASQCQVMSSLSTVDDRISRVEKMLLAQADQVRESQRTQFGSSYNMSVQRRVSPARGRVQNEFAQSGGVGIRVTPCTVACRPGCACACHAAQKVTSPRVLNRIFGHLFLGYTDIPYLSPKCSEGTCGKNRGSKLSVEYWFPMGYISSTIVRMQVGYQPSTGALFQLQTLRAVPDDAMCIKFAMSGNIEGLQHLFSRGLASPRDVSPGRGYTLLRWALYAKQYRTCEFLVNAGADPDYRPVAASDNSPRIKASNFLLEEGLPEVGVDALRLITKGGYHEDFVDESGFTLIHRIVLGLSLHILEEELAQHPEEINTQDTMGRTPLAWAAARGDARAVLTLLSHGADPNILDSQISGPVSNAAARGYSAVVRLLLEAGAYPDPTTPSGVQKGSPLLVAARNSTDIVLLKSLLDFGAEVDARGTDKLTSLIHAARNDNASFASLLLEYGADINAASTTGATPLTTAITHNSHNVLRLVLDRWHEYSDCPRLRGPHLLPIAATYADMGTLQILAETDHLKLRHDRNYAVGDFASRLRQRPDFSEKLAMAFDTLLDVINWSPPKFERKCPESLLEMGVLRPKLSSQFSSQTTLVDDEESPSCLRFFSCNTSPIIGGSDMSSERSYDSENDDVFADAHEKGAGRHPG